MIGDNVTASYSESAKLKIKAKIQQLSKLIKISFDNRKPLRVIFYLNKLKLT